MQKIALLLVTLQALPLLGATPQTRPLLEAPPITAQTIIDRARRQASPYEILGVRDKALREEYMAAYKKLAVQFHPDRHPGELDQEAMRAINNAKDHLEKPEDIPANHTYQAQPTTPQTGIHEWLLGITLLSGLTSIVATQLWYQRLAPYKPLLCITPQGIATQEKQATWHQVYDIQLVTNPHTKQTAFEFRYAKQNRVRDSIILNEADLSVSAELLAILIIKYRGQSSDQKAPLFPTKSLTREQLQKIRKTGFFQDANQAIICYKKPDWLKLLAGSTAAYGVFAASAYRLWSKLHQPAQK